MRFDILSLFPDYFRGPFDHSMIKRAKEKGLVEIGLVDIRDFAYNKHRKVDDRPYGGGPGMVLMPEPVAAAIRSVKKERSLVIYLSPQGEQLTAALCRELALEPHLVVLCGHYEGVDERVLQKEVDREITIGPYVVTSGCSAAIVLVDSVSRFIPGVLGNEESAAQDSFQEGDLLDAPHYTRPDSFEGLLVPEILQSGDHKKIAEWRRNRALEKTYRLGD